MSERHGNGHTNRWADDSTEDVIGGLRGFADWLAEQGMRSESDIQVELLREAARRLERVEMQDRAIEELARRVRDD